MHSDASGARQPHGSPAPGDREGGGCATVLTGLIGAQIQGSRSPEMHVAEAESLGFRLDYRLFDFEQMGKTADDLPAMLDSLEAAGFAGVNVTHPYKQRVIASLTELSEQARLIGAVNTIVFQAGQRIGYNTDCWGFTQGLRHQLGECALGRVVQFGAGGAGAATATAILQMGCKTLVLMDQDRTRAEAIAERLAATFADRTIGIGGDAEQEIARADGIINATPVGMTGHPGSVVARGLLRPELWVADVVYFPIETELLRDAAAAGCRVANGGPMAVFQAARAFDLFTGRESDHKRMMARF